MLALIFTVVIYTAGARLLHLGMAAAPAIVGCRGTADLCAVSHEAE